MGCSGRSGGGHPHLLQARCTSWPRGTRARSLDYLDLQITINLEINRTIMASRRNMILENLRHICALMKIRNLLKSKRGIMPTRAFASLPIIAQVLKRKKVKGLQDSRTILSKYKSIPKPLLVIKFLTRMRPFKLETYLSCPCLLVAARCLT